MHRLSQIVGVLALALVASASRAAPRAYTAPVKGIPGQVFDRIVHFSRIALSTYAGDSCHIQNVPRLTTFYNATTDIYGWISRDDATRELIISFRGTVSDINHAENKNWTLADVAGTLPECVGCLSYGGYYLNWLSIMDQVYASLDAQKKAYPDYSLIVTGHSLGGGMAALCSAHLVSRYPHFVTYTYGEPRVGNQAFASFFDQHFGTGSITTTRYFRTTHTTDGVVPLPPYNYTYRHQGLELWYLDPPSACNTYICPPEGFCAEAATPYNETGINAAHNTYFGVSAGNCTLTA